MRRMLAVLLTGVMVAALAGCGRSASAGAPANPKLAALSYFPPTAPFVLSVATDARSGAVRQLAALERSNPSYAFAATAMFAQLGRLGIDYNRDLRPLFGNPIAIGTSGPVAGGSRTPFLAAWVTHSATRLSALMHKLHGLRPAGSHDGAQLFAGSGAAAAVAGPTLLLARSTPLLDAALDRHAHDQGVTAADYARATTGISPGGLMVAFGDLTNVLSGRSVAGARRIPWVAAIRGYGVSVSATPGAVTLRYHVDTGGRPLSASQLPIASGTTAPSLAGDEPIRASLRDPAQLVSFIESVLQQTRPGTYARFLRQEAQLARRSGFNARTLAGMLTGDLNVESDTRTTIARAQVSNPAVARAMLARLARAEARGALPHHAQLHTLPGGLYSLSAPHQQVTLGVLGDQLVAGRGSVAALRAFAAAPTSSAAANTGSLAFQISFPQLLTLGLGEHSVPPAARQLLALLGDLTGSASATTSGLTGTATIALR